MKATYTIGDDAHPAVHSKVERVLAVLNDEIRRHGAVTQCGHARNSRVMLVCAAHPAGGVRCPRCAAEHARRHSWELEHECDGCGRAVDNEPWSGLVAPVEVRRLKVRRPRGEVGLLVGEIHVIGLGLCVDCHVPPKVVA